MAPKPKHDEEEEDRTTTREFVTETVPEQQLSADTAAPEQEEETGTAKPLVKQGKTKWYDRGDIGDLPGVAALYLPNRVGKIHVVSSLGVKHEVDITGEVMAAAMKLDRRLVIEFPDGEKNMVVFD